MNSYESGHINPFLRDDGVIAAILGSASKDDTNSGRFEPLGAIEPQLSLHDMLTQPDQAQRFSFSSSVYTSRWSADSSLSPEEVIYTAPLHIAQPAPPPLQRQAASGKLHKLVLCRNFFLLQRKRIARHRAVQALLVKLAGRDHRLDPHWCDTGEDWDAQTAAEKWPSHEKRPVHEASKKRYGYF